MRHCLPPLTWSVPMNKSTLQGIEQGDGVGRQEQRNVMTLLPVIFLSL